MDAWLIKDLLIVFGICAGFGVIFLILLPLVLLTSALGSAGAAAKSTKSQSEERPG